MFKFLSSLKTKIVIAVFLAAIGIFLIAETAIENNERQVQLETSIKQKTETAKIQQAEIDSKNKADQQKQEAQKQQQEKDAAMESKYNAAKSYYDGKEYTRTINACDEIIKDDENNYKAYTLKGIALCYLSIATADGNKYDEGMSTLDKALEIKPDYGYALFNKGLGNELFAHYDEAIQWYKKDLEKENFVWSYYGIASIYGRRGDVQNSVLYLNKAIEADPSTDVKGEAAKEVDFNNVRDSSEFQAAIKK